MNTFNSGSLLIKRQLQEYRDQAEVAMKKGDIKTARELWKSMAQNYRKLAQLEINQLEYTRLLKKPANLSKNPVKWKLWCRLLTRFVVMKVLMLGGSVPM